MSRKYKFYDNVGTYFVSFAVVYWIDLFTRARYSNCIVDNLNFYAQKGMEIYAWCIMPSHIHLIFGDENAHPEILLGRFKSYTSKALQQLIRSSPQESRGLCSRARTLDMEQRDRLLRRQGPGKACIMIIIAHARARAPAAKLKDMIKAVNHIKALMILRLAILKIQVLMVELHLNLCLDHNLRAAIP